jgi:hypothetical protein
MTVKIHCKHNKTISLQDLLRITQTTALVALFQPLEMILKNLLNGFQTAHRKREIRVEIWNVTM